MSASVNQLERWAKFLKDNSLKEHSLFRKFCQASIDLLIFSGLIYLLAKISYDQDYWKEAPYPMHALLVIQYCGLVLMMRMPVTRIRAATQSVTLCLVFMILIVNTSLMCYWLVCLRQNESWSLQ